MQGSQCLQAPERRPPSTAPAILDTLAAADVLLKVLFLYAGIILEARIFEPNVFWLFSFNPHLSICLLILEKKGERETEISCLPYTLQLRVEPANFWRMDDASTNQLTHLARALPVFFFLFTGVGIISDLGCKVRLSYLRCACCRMCVVADLHENATTF